MSATLFNLKENGSFKFNHNNGIVLEQISSTSTLITSRQLTKT